MTDPDEPRVACVGCGGWVPDIEGPVHRYMTASPGCWQAYGELLAGALPPGPHSAITIDAYAATHPGVPGPQSTPSVWIHLLALCFVLERGWPAERAPWLRGVAADAFRGWPWLPPPASMGAITAIDVATAAARGEIERARELAWPWVDGAWRAWAMHHAAVRARADFLAGLIG
jgi:hypothetical protein